MTQKLCFNCVVMTKGDTVMQRVALSPQFKKVVGSIPELAL